MSRLVTAAEFRLAAELPRLEVMDIVRGAVFVGALLLAWISLRPFDDLSSMQIADVTTGNELPTYATFAGLALVAFALVMRDNFSALRTLKTPALMLFTGWLFVTVLLSSDPGTSIRRLTLTACVIVVAASMPLLARSQAELARWLAVASLALLAACYVGILLAPHLSIHLATDAQEPGLAGAWRGVFGHKNGAAAIMAMLLFIGIYLLRVGNWISGIAVAGLSLLFLIYSAGKSSLALCFLVLLLTSLMGIVRSFWARAVMLFVPLLLLNLLSVGTVMSDSLAELAKLLPLDTSFTGRSDIWTFALQAVHERLITGYGFSAFWGTSAMQNLPQGKEWAAFAAHSHNGYLDTALGMGLPGLVLLVAGIVIAPLRNFQSADEGGNGSPLLTLYFRIWLFSLYLSAMESFFFDRADPIWFTFLIAVFGLHYFSRFRAEV